jgi:S-adenosyl-L-methionine hydrolase (adenosine-forming)
MAKIRLIALLTDFGTADGYAAAMKGVILSRAPRAPLVDLTHDVPPHDVRAGAWALGQAWPWFPRGTLHVAVVDPGVGTSRRALLVEADGQFFLAPDNGLLGWVLAGARRALARELRADWPGARVPSATFHGRDVFAEAAGRLAAGSLTPAQAGPIVRDPMRPAWASPAPSGGRRGEIVHVDRFGNLITNIPSAALAALRGPAVRVGRRVLDVARTYGDAEPGAAVALAGSAGMVEIAVREGRADRRLNRRRGDAVEVLDRTPAKPAPRQARRTIS